MTLPWLPGTSFKQALADEPEAAGFMMQPGPIVIDYGGTGMIPMQISVQNGQDSYQIPGMPFPVEAITGVTITYGIIAAGSDQDCTQLFSSQQLLTLQNTTELYTGQSFNIGIIAQGASKAPVGLYNLYITAMKGGQQLATGATQIQVVPTAQLSFDPGSVNVVYGSTSNMAADLNTTVNSDQSEIDGVTYTYTLTDSQGADARPYFSCDLLATLSGLGSAATISAATQHLAILATGTAGRAAVGSYTLTLTAAQDTRQLGSATLNITIKPTLEAATAFFTDGLTTRAYTGEALTPAVTVQIGSDTLTQGTDYRVKYLNNTEVGRAYALIIGEGDYDGEDITLVFFITASFTTPGPGGNPVVNPLLTIANIPDQTYTGSAITPTPAVAFDGARLTPGKDFTYTYAANTKVGTATLTIQAVAAAECLYTGSVSITFRIVPATLTLNFANVGFSRTSAAATTLAANGAPKLVWPQGFSATNATADAAALSVNTTAVSYYLKSVQSTNVYYRGSFALAGGASANYKLAQPAQPVSCDGQIILSGGGVVNPGLPPTLASFEAPAAVTMGQGAGQGVRLDLSAPAVTNEGTSTVSARGWLISASTTKPATSTLGLTSWNSSSWKTFSTDTYMSLSLNGHYLAYWAKNATGYGYSPSIQRITVNYATPYPYLGGENRLDTSAQTALDAWSPTGCTSAVFAVGSEFYDALAGSYLAGILKCPVLLVSPTLSYNASVKAAAKTLGVRTAYVVGGKVTANMMASVGFTSYKRVSNGKDAATDAVDVIKYATTTLGQPRPTQVFLTTDSNFPDALGASAYSAQAQLNIPILFAKGLNDSTKAAAEVRALGSVKTLYVLGSSVAVSASAAQKVKSSYTRLGGADRNQTAAALYATFGPKVAALNASGRINSVGVASGQDFPDALGGGVAQAHLGGVLLINPGTVVSAYIKTELDGGSYTISGKSYKVGALVKYLTNFNFYGQGTIDTATRDTISTYVR
jgi:putative cell wall-binding protein